MFNTSVTTMALSIQERAQSGKLSRQTRSNMNAASACVPALSLEVCELNNQWFSVKRWSWWCEPPKTYQSRSWEASCHLDLTLSHILTCGTLLWKETEKTNKQTGLIKTLVWGEEAIKRLIMHGICIKALKVIPTQTCSTSHKHVRLLDSFTRM